MPVVVICPSLHVIINFCNDSVSALLYFALVMDRTREMDLLRP